MALAVFALTTGSAAAAVLPVSGAQDRSLAFAKRTCSHDKACVDYGVLNCDRQSSHVVLCRIYDERDTKVQGRYRCERMIRLAFHPVTRKVPVTGLGRWHC